MTSCIQQKYPLVVFAACQLYFDNQLLTHDNHVKIEIQMSVSVVVYHSSCGVIKHMLCSEKNTHLHFHLYQWLTDSNQASPPSPTSNGIVLGGLCLLLRAFSSFNDVWIEISTNNGNIWFDVLIRRCWRRWDQLIASWNIRLTSWFVRLRLE